MNDASRSPGSPARSDPYDLQRFVDAQQGIHAAALEELRQGAKRSHWMWFVFPQLRGLGHSSMAHHYGIGGLDEAAAYLAHPVLGARLIECTRAVLEHEGLTLHRIFGSPDDLKFVSSMTLFSSVPGAPALLVQALERFNDGQSDRHTVRLLAQSARSG